MQMFQFIGDFFRSKSFFFFSLFYEPFKKVFIEFAVIQRLNPQPLHWKGEALTTRLPEKSLLVILILLAAWTFIWLVLHILTQRLP